MMVMMSATLLAQAVKETSQPLSKKAQKGFLDDVTISGDGTINLLYKIGGDKKKDELFYEAYSFDNNLKFIEAKSANELKVESKPDKEVQYMSAWVGGGTSFDILSMKLRINVTKRNQKWDYKRQRYLNDKVISSETIKLKNEGGRAYFGVDQYSNDETGDFIVLAYYETKDKKNPKQYVLLTITFDGDVTEKNLDINGAYSMVFCTEASGDAPGQALGKQDFVMVMAPTKGTAEADKYIYLHYDIKGNLKNKLEFKSPSTNLLINSANVKKGEVIFLGLSTKSKDYYEEIFKDYAPIVNPNFTESENAQMMRYDRAAAGDMDFFHLLKFNGNKMVFASTASVDDFKSKKKFAPGEKSGKVYNGKKFFVQNFEVTPANEYLVAGQLTSRVNIGNGTYVPAYGDVICFHFDSNGALKAQYAIDKVFEDKKSEIFDMPQKFFLSGDGKYAYWEIMEVKGFTGYDTYMDAYNGRKTFKPRYFPRITRIDLQNATLGEFKTPGQQKFFTYNDGRLFDANTLTRTFIGRDEDHENLWVSKVVFE
jgi:hypothetical protein